MTSNGFTWSGIGSSLNSTSTPLSALATYTGSAELNSCADVGVSCKTDQDGILYFDFSNNGTDWDTFPVDGFAVSAGIHEFHTAVKLGRSFRVRFVNTTNAAQTYLRLYTYYGQFRQGNAPLNSVVGADSDAITVRSVDTIVDVSLGRFSGFAPVNKFGRAPNGVQITSTDIWDLADATPTQQIWVAPTQARIHTITSTSTSDDSNSGVGARTIRIYGLTSWDTAEVSEVVSMDGNGSNAVQTANAYVIIHRMRVVTCGNTGPNVGTITATANTDNTITAVIRPTIGSTAMAIYGWPSTQTLLVSQISASLMQAASQARDARLRLFHNTDPGTSPSLYIEKDVRGLQSNGTSSDTWPYLPYLPLPGPGILKLNAIGSAADLDMTGSFDAILVNN